MEFNTSSNQIGSKSHKLQLMMEKLFYIFFVKKMLSFFIAVDNLFFSPGKK